MQCAYAVLNRGTDKYLDRQGKKHARTHVRDVRDFNNIETRAVIKYFFLQGKEPNEIHAILTEKLDCFLPGWVKDLSAPLYCHLWPEYLYHIFPHYPTTARLFGRERNYLTKNVFWFPLQLRSETFLILRVIFSEMLS